MFLMNQWYAAALPSELNDKPLARTICGEAIVMYRSAAGKPVALEDRCPHRYAPLSAGRCNGDNIVCPYHGIVFDPSGACALIPHQPVIPQKMRVRSYPLVERWGWAWIWMGDAALADPNLIPAWEWFGKPEWKSFYRYFHVEANWQLCADNLLDLSHTPYVHTATVGTPDMDKFPLETWTEGNRVLSRRVMTQVIPGPFVAQWGNFGGRIDRVTNGEWCPASNIAVELYYEDAHNNMTLRLTNPLTPETDRTTHIWFTWSRNFGGDDADYVEKFEQQSASVQDEDNRMLVLQQKVVDRGGPLPTVSIKADSALLAARRAVQKLLQEEEAVLRKATA
jgi:phenylpropionate dioxygenase-like ring-hydroxylating dioxygenase large terminal subunit